MSNYLLDEPDRVLDRVLGDADFIVDLEDDLDLGKKVGYKRSRV